jgi:AhpD family alkylhydroperoxidase
MWLPASASLKNVASGFSRKDGDSMSEHYHDATDGQRLRDMRKLAPVDFEAWLNLNKITAREDGAIPRKYRELIAAAVACAIQCPYCIEAHAGAAKVAGASREELVEATMLAAAIRAGGAAMHGTMALKFYDQK